MKSSAHRLAQGCALLAVATTLAACGLQRSGIEGTITAQSIGSGADLGDGSAYVPDSTASPVPGASSAPGATTGPDLAGGGSGPAVGPGASSGSGSGPQTIPGGPSSPPVSKGLSGELVMGYIAVTGFDQLGQVVVVKTQNQGDYVAQTNALASWVNSHGGIGGKKLVPTTYAYNAMQASPDNDTAACKSLSEDKKAFAVVLHGQIHFQGRDCYLSHKVIAFEGSNYGFGEAFYSSHSPYDISMTYPAYEPVERALVAELRAASWFGTDKKVGIARWDDAPFDNPTNVLKAELTKAGITTINVQSITNDDIGGMQGGINAAIGAFNAAGIEHVMFIGSAPLQSFFQQQAGSQFTYGMSSYDSPLYGQLRLASAMTGAKGIGFSPVNDVLDDQYKWPQPGMEAFCHDLYKAAGINLSHRIDADNSTKQALSYCEYTILLKQVADQMSGPVTTAAWVQKAEQVAQRTQMATSFATIFGAGHHAASAAYRTWTFDSGCSCVKYTSGLKALS